MLGRSLPFRSGNEAFNFAVGHLHPEQRNESSLRRPVALLLNDRLSRQRISSCVQQFANRYDSKISPRILRATELAHGRFDHHLLTVDPGRHIVLGGDEERGLFGFLRQLEGEAEIVLAGRGFGQRIIIRRPDPFRRRFIISAQERHIPRDPFRFPVVGREQSHLPPTGLAVGRSLSLRVPNPHLPVVAAARLDGGTTVRHIDRLIGFNAAAVPHIGAILRQSFGRTGHTNFIRRLAGATPGILELP